MSLFVSPVVRATDANLLALSGAKLYFYAAGTTTLQSVYSDSDLSTPLTNPVIADSGGLFVPIYLDPALSYRVILKTSAGATVQDVDPYSLYASGTIEATPPFDNTAYYSTTQYLLNGAAPGTMYSELQGGENATEALTSAVIVPSSATNHQTNAVSSYVRSDRAQPGNGGDVAAYHQAVSNANNAAVFAINAVAADTAGKTGQTLGIELDYNVSAADTDVNGVNVTIVANTVLSGDRNGVAVRGAFSANSQWSNGFLTADGAVASTGYAVFVGSDGSTAGTNRDSQKAAFVSYNTSNTRFISTILGDHLGGMAIRAGGSTGAIAFQDPTGSANWAYINSNGLGYGTGVGGAVTQATSKSTTTPAINKACGQVTMNNATLAAGAKVSFVVANTLVAATDTVIVSVASGGTANAYRASVTAITAGVGFTVTVENITGGSLSESPVINFALLKGVAS